MDNKRENFIGLFTETLKLRNLVILFPKLKQYDHPRALPPDRAQRRRRPLHAASFLNQNTRSP
jgi:hypothetical protein